MLHVEHNLKLIEALESGEYKQIYGFMSSDAGYCFVGLACHLPCFKEITERLLYLEYYGWTASFANQMMWQNDKRRSFKQLAKILRARMHAEQEFLVPQIAEPIPSILVGAVI
jgi:hypothetical protein